MNNDSSNPGKHTPTKQHSSQLPKNPYKPCQNPQSSDVITLAGTSGLPAAFRTFTLQKQVPKNVTNRGPLNCRLKSRLNRLFSRNNCLNHYFLLAWTPLPREPGNRSLNGQSEPVLRPEYLMSRASASPLTISRFLWCQTFLWIPCLGKYSRSFRSNRGSSTPKRNQNWANLGIGAGKCPDLGCGEHRISYSPERFF